MILLMGECVCYCACRHHFTSVLCLLLISFLNKSDRYLANHLHTQLDSVATVIQNCNECNPVRIYTVNHKKT